MKRTLILSLLISSAIFGQIWADVPQEKLNAIYVSLNGDFPPSDVGDSMMFVESSFNKSVPPQDQADAIAALIDRAAKDTNGTKVMFNAMHLIEMAPIRQISRWNERLESTLLSQVGNTNPGIRCRLASIFLTHSDFDHRELVLPLIYSLLRGDDDHYKEGHLDVVIKSKWPEGKKICEDYIKSTPWNEKNKQSLLVAKAFTNPTDAHRAEQLFAKEEKPHALKEFLAYAASHKDDPDYVVSVNVAEQGAKLLEENLDFDKNKAEYKKSVDAVKSNPAIIAKYGSVKDIELDDWGNNWGLAGAEQTPFNEFGAYQFRLKGAFHDGVVRIQWHYRNFQFDVPKIEEVAPDNTVLSFWTEETR